MTSGHADEDHVVWSKSSKAPEQLLNLPYGGVYQLLLTFWTKIHHVTQPSSADGVMNDVELNVMSDKWTLG